MPFSIRISRLHYYCRNPLDLAEIITIIVTMDCSVSCRLFKRSLLHTPQQKHRSCLPFFLFHIFPACTPYRSECISFIRFLLFFNQWIAIWTEFQKIGTQLCSIEGGQKKWRGRKSSSSHSFTRTRLLIIPSSTR